MERRQKIKKTPNKKLNQINRWKLAFLILVGLIIGTSTFVALRVIENREPSLTKSKAATLAKGDVVATLSTNKEQINKLINSYLKTQQTAKLNYQFYLNDQAVLEGKYQFLGVEVPLFVYFDPYKLENGNIQLKVKSISVGTLNLGAATVLSFISKQYTLPSFVHVNADNSYIELKLNEL
ncbi:MAG: YpmS family protein, partial [Streptococcaceae bacterium]|nr:YpmS family protein [Streptococcaceae bacterium]